MAGGMKRQGRTMWCRCSYEGSLTSHRALRLVGDRLTDHRAFVACRRVGTAGAAFQAGGCAAWARVRASAIAVFLPLA